MGGFRGHVNGYFFYFNSYNTVSQISLTWMRLNLLKPVNWCKENHRVKGNKRDMTKLLNDWRWGNNGNDEKTKNVLLASRFQEFLIFVLTLQPEITSDFCLAPSSKVQAPKLESPEPLHSPGLPEHQVLAPFPSSSPAKYTCPGPWTNCFPVRKQDETLKSLKHTTTTTPFILGSPLPTFISGNTCLFAHESPAGYLWIPKGNSRVKESNDF